MTLDHLLNTPVSGEINSTSERSYDPSFPAVIDSTILSAFTDCPLKAYREYFLKLGSKYPSIHLHAGGAFARAVEVIRRSRWEEELAINECMQAGFAAFTIYWGEFEAPDVGSGANKTYERMWEAVEEYFDEYPLDTDPIRPYIFPDGKNGIEFTFGIPLPLNHPDTGDPIVFGGRADLLGYYNNAMAIVDEKTTSQLGASWVDQWKMRSQFHGYIWAAQLSGIEVSTALVRGISILKTKFGHAQVVLTFSDFMLERWYQAMYNKVAQMIDLYQLTKDNPEIPPESIWTMSFGTACSNYGGCMFTDLCTSEDPTIWYGDYAIRNWNPLEKNPVAAIVED